MEWLTAAGILVAFILALSWLSAAVGLIAWSPEAASAFTFFVIFLPYPSSAFVPVDTMPSWIQGFAESQPLTPVVESLRGLVLDMPVGSEPAIALVWSAAILATSIGLSTVFFHRRTT